MVYSHRCLKLLVWVCSLCYVASRCNNPLMEGARLSASSERVGKEARYARLHGPSAWTADLANQDQHITVDLQAVYALRRLASQGRDGSDDWVSGYRIQYSRNGRDFADYFGPRGGVWDFEGNRDGDSVVVNEFAIPIVAQFIRIRPINWNSRIAMRLEVYGWVYSASSFGMTGSTVIERSLADNPSRTLSDAIEFRFRTLATDAVLLYGSGSQGDIIIVQLIDNKLHLKISLGTVDFTWLSVGSLLDDNLWHDVRIERRRRHVTLTVDRVQAAAEIAGDYRKLDLNHQLLVGGVTHLRRGVDVFANFSGCLEDVFFNELDVLAEAAAGGGGGGGGEGGFTVHSTDTQQQRQSGQGVCSVTDQSSSVVTFTTRRSHLEYEGVSDLAQLNISLGFRTFEPNGLLVYHKFLSRGHIKVYLASGRLTVELDGEQMAQPVTLVPFGRRRLFSDGAWHSCSALLATNRLLLVVDGYHVITQRLFTFRSGAVYLFGGGYSESSELGFMGCMRDMASDGFRRGTNTREHEKQQHADEIVADSCHLVDRCYPNPCRHNGTCHQDTGGFRCDCSGTGYGGSVCYTAINPVSCTKYFERNSNNNNNGNVNGYGDNGFDSSNNDNNNNNNDDGSGVQSVEVQVDVDGSGPLAPFPVLCRRGADGQVETHVTHDVRGDETVDGFEAAGSYIRDVTYRADYQQLEALVNASLACRQSLVYTCRGARLLNTVSAGGGSNGSGSGGGSGGSNGGGSGGSSGGSSDYQPLAWWVSRANARMDYWGGGQPGSRSCRCGLQANCVDPALDCNCDAAADRELVDGGDLVHKDDLPVRQLRFGDTGTLADNKYGRYRLGHLICTGDAWSDDTVTFRKADATVDLPTVELGYNSDIYFEFRTAATSGTFFHITGPEDFLEVLLEGSAVKLQLSLAGREKVVLLSTTWRLDDNGWHSLMIELNRLEVRLVLDGALQETTPIHRSPHPLHFTSKLVIGARTSYENGYVGCVRAFSVNGRLQLLRPRAELGLYGVLPGCVGKCASSPCLNGGQCTERYSGYTCNCRFTAFKGPICADEIGVGMNRDYMISYDLAGNYKSTVEEDIVVGFSTTSPSGFLLGLVGTTNEYMTVEVSNSGRIRVVFDFGFERQEVVYPDTEDRVFKAGQFHTLHVFRSDSGQSLHIQVDEYPELVKRFQVNANSDIQFNSISRLYIGKNETMSEGFLGCISRVKFDDIYPLKEMFQENRPAHVSGNRASIHEDFCGVEPQRWNEEDTETRPPPEVDQSIVSSLYHRVDSALIGGVVALVLLVLLLAAALVCRYAARHKGDYLTREDSGADSAEDADEAVAMGRTGHHIEKMKEFFI